MRAYSIFDDFPKAAVERLACAGIDVTVHPLGTPRPDDAQMENILKEYECVIIGTSQKIRESMFESIDAPRLIATASVGVDHIRVPEEKRDLVTVINAPDSNALSVAEYVVGAMLLTRKRFLEGGSLYSKGLDNKKLIKKPEDIHGTTVGLVGAGRISTKVIDYLRPFGVQFLCYTRNPDAHRDLTERAHVQFVALEELAKRSDIIAVNVPSTQSTQGLINEKIIAAMKDTCVFISISREQVMDVHALAQKAQSNPNFYLVLDLDVKPEYAGMHNGRNIIITPHIAGGTIESRNRMFLEVAERVSDYTKLHCAQER